MMTRQQRRQELRDAGYRRAKGKRGSKSDIRPHAKSAPPLPEERQPNSAGLYLPEPGQNMKKTKTGILIPEDK